MFVEYTCKFCGQVSLVEYEPVPDIDLTKFLAMVCCDHCAAFRQRRPKTHQPGPAREPDPF